MRLMEIVGSLFHSFVSSQYIGVTDDRKTTYHDMVELCSVIVKFDEKTDTGRESENVNYYELL